MLHTLLPLQEKRALQRVYHTHLSVVFIFMISVSVVIGIISLIPTFVSVKSEEVKQYQKLAGITNSKQINGVTSIEKQFAVGSQLLNSINEDSGSGMTLSKIIEDVISTRGNVDLVALAIDKHGTSTVVMNIEGVSPDRTSLLNFKSRLADLYPNNSVDLPLTDLKSSSNIKFSIVLTTPIKHE